MSELGVVGLCVGFLGFGVVRSVVAVQGLMWGESEMAVVGVRVTG